MRLNLSYVPWRGMLSSIRCNLSASIWPTLKAVLAVLIGVILSLLIGVYSLSNVPILASGAIDVKSDTYIEKSNLISALILSRNMLAYMFFGAFLGCLGSFWRWLQKHWNIPKNSFSETYLIVLDIFTIFFPLAVIYVGVLSFNNTIEFLLKELDKHLVLLPPAPVSRAISNVASYLIEHPSYLFLGGVLTIILSCIVLIFGPKKYEQKSVTPSEARVPNPDYPVLIEPMLPEDGSGYLATVPDLPGCMSDGETREAAARNVGDAIEAWLEEARALGRAIPTPSRHLVPVQA